MNNLLSVDENEMPTLEKFGNIVRASRYDKKGMPISDSIGNLMHYEYLFDNQGDMLQKKENVTKQEEVYLFDRHNRLNIWRTFDRDTLRKEITATYDNIFGNLTSRSDSDMVFHYGEFGLSPHALTSVDAPIGSCQNKVNSYSYTDFKMLESASNGTDSIHITYGADFQRRKMQIFKNDTLIQTRYYFNNYEEEHYPDGRIRKIDYITGQMGLVGVRVSNNGKDTLLHAFTDKFGNLVLLADTEGRVVERLAYDPWGARRNPDDWTKADTGRHVVARGYSMHEHLDHLGLINMNARIYDVTTCSFLSPDPLIAEPENWLNYNRYLYCLGNPVKFADPSGMYATWNEAQMAYWNAASLGYDPGPVLSGGDVAEGNEHNYYFTVFSCENGEPTITANFSGFENYSNYASTSQMYQSFEALSTRLTDIESYATDIVFSQPAVATTVSAPEVSTSYVGSTAWNALSNTNNGVAFVVSSANQYVSNALSYSTRYYIEGFSKISPEVRFPTPVGNFYTTFQAVKTVANVTNVLGKVTGGVGLYMTYREISEGQKEWMGEGGLDFAMGLIGFIPGWGWAVSGTYFIGKMAFEYSGNKFW